MISIKSKLSLMLLIFIALSYTNITQAQQLNRIYEDIGGGSGSGSNIAESDDNTIYYVLGAAVLAGVVIYAVLQNKKAKDKPKTDTTAVILNDDFLEKQLTFNDRIEKYKSKIPIDVSFGMQNNFLRQEEKRYFIGVAYNF